MKVTPEGKVKVLDFGLAKAFAAAPEIGGDPGNSPTLSAMPTLPGVILGTAAYMSPEQARGKTVDRRTDIWALGCVLFELLTGQGAFHRPPSRNQSRARQQADMSAPAKGPLPNGRGSDVQTDEPDTVQEIIARILQAEPDWSALPANMPHGIRVLLRRCLEKDRTRRYHAAADVLIQIEETNAAPAPGPARRKPRPFWQWIVVMAFAVGALAIGVSSLRKPSAVPLPVTHVVMATPTASQLLLSTTAISSRPMMALSLDGSHLAYIARGTAGSPQLFVRAMDTPDDRPMAGTDLAVDPFFSPDGQWIAFFSGGTLKKISINGGPALTLCNVNDPRGATWGPNDTIIFSPNQSDGLWQVSANGGQPKKITSLKSGEQSHRWPQFLPDGKNLLFSSLTSSVPDNATMTALRLDTGDQKVLLQGGTFPRYAASGHFVYYRGGTMMALPFDPVRLEVTGAPTPVVEGVMAGTSQSGSAQFSISDNGSLIYLSGGSQTVGFTLVWVDRRGQAESLPAPQRDYASPRLSPDGKRALVVVGQDIWVYDIARDTLTRLTFEGDNSNNAPVWMPDGKKFLFNSTKAGPINIFWKAADGSGTDERLVAGPNQTSLGSVSPDGKTLVFGQVDPKTGRDIWMTSLEDRKPQPLLQTSFNETTGRVSPDGHWLAYLSDESGRYEVYVRPFPGPGGKWQISTEGGTELAWSPKGNEIFYRAGASKEKMMVVDIQTSPTFSAGKSRVLFEASFISRTQGAFYSVAPDAQRFLMLKAIDQSDAPASQVHVVLNWFEELRRKVPAAR